MANESHAVEALKALGMTESQISGILSQAETQRKEAEESRLREKSFDLSSAQSLIESLQTQVKTLSDQLAGIEVMHTAAKALDEVEKTRGPQPQTYTMEDLATVMEKAFAKAVEPILARQKEEGDRAIAIMTQLQEVNGVVKTAQARVNELTGELPRALRMPENSRYADAVGPQGNRPAISEKEESDMFGWVDSYLAGI